MSDVIKKILCFVLIFSLMGILMLPASAAVNDGITNEKSRTEISSQTLELVTNLGQYNISKQDQKKILETLANRKTFESIITNKERELEQKPLKIDDKRKGILLTEEFSYTQ